MGARGIAAIVGLVAVAVAVAFAPSEPSPAESAFPGENGLIAFTQFVPGPENLNCEVFTVDPETFETVNLTNSPECEIAPAWSPDGSMLAVSRNTELWVMNSDGSDPRPVGGGIEGFDPAWSPDGQRLAYESGDLGLYVVDVDGGKPLRIASASGAGLDGGPAWSPDGQRIAFVDGPVWLVNPDGTNLVALGISGNGISWSPDGRCLILNAYPTLTVFDISTSESGPVPAGGGIASWSPDGKQIAVVLERGIKIASVADSDVIALTNNVHADWPDWQRVESSSPPQPCQVPGVGTLPAGGGAPEGSHANAGIFLFSISLVIMLAGVRCIIPVIRGDTRD